MGVSVQPDPEWYSLHSPEEWQRIFQVALNALHTNHKDADALEALQQATEALNSFERPAIEAGEHTLSSGWGNPLEAAKGTAEGVVGGVLAPVMLTKTAVSQGPAAMLDEMVNGLKAVPDEIASGDARRIGRLGGNVAGGILAGRAIGTVARPVGEIAKRPGLKNALITAQTERAAASHAALDEMAAQRAAQAPLKQELMSGRVQLQGKQLEAQGIKNKLLGHKEAYEADPRQTEATQLRNELLRRKLGEDEGDNGGSSAPVTEPPPNSPAPNRPAPPNYPEYDKEARPDPYNPPDLPNPPDPIQNIIDELKRNLGQSPPSSTNEALRGGIVPLSEQDIWRLLGKKPTDFPRGDIK